MKKKRNTITLNRAAPIVLGGVCISVVAIQQNLFQSTLTAVAVYALASFAALIVWYGCIALAAIGPLGRITRIGEENPPTSWLLIVASIATIVAGAALFGADELFRILLTS